MLLKKCSWARTRAGGTTYFASFFSYFHPESKFRKIVIPWIHLKGIDYSVNYKIIREISIYCFVLNDIVSIVFPLVSQIGQ